MVTHYDLCKKTAEWSAKDADVCLFDYQSYASGEFPDVLSYHSSGTMLYEIKVSRSDFKSDAGKDCRQRLRPHTIKVRSKKTYDWYVDSGSGKNVKFPVTYGRIEKIVVQKPHLGSRRYYVCPWGLIKPEEVKLFGLYWYREKDGKFFKKKESEKFRRDIHTEQALLIHALRKQVNVGNDKVVVKKYKER